MKRLRVLMALTCLALVFGTTSVSAIEIISGPFIQLTDENEVTLTFQTRLPGMSRVEYGTTADLGQTTELFYALDSFHRHVLQDIEVDTEYYYRIIAEDFLGNRTIEEGVFVSPALGDVHTLQIHGDGEGLVLTWNRAFGAVSYEVQRGTSASGPFEAIATVEGISYRDESVENVGSAFYVIVPIARDGEKGDPSEVAAPQFITLDLKEWVNRDGISWDSNPSDQNLDSTGWGLPAEELPKGDFTLRWDSTTEVPFKGFYTADGEKNTITVDGQVIPVPPGSYRGLWLLVVSTHGDTIGADLILNYRDGSQDVYKVSATDWCLGSPVAGEKMLIKPPYRMSQTGRENLSCGVWLLEEYEVNPDLILESIVLPKDPPGETELHILGITLRL